MSYSRVILRINLDHSVKEGRWARWHLAGSGQQPSEISARLVPPVGAVDDVDDGDAVVVVVSDGNQATPEWTG